MREKVRAAVMSAPGNIQTVEFPYPKVATDAALVRMELSGICGTDKHMYKGETTHPGGQETAFPIIPGHENVGVIEELGKDATGLEVEGNQLREGDRVVAICDVQCGQCYMCRTSFGFTTSCERDLGYGTTLSCKDPPHLFGGWAEYMYILPKALLARVPADVAPEAAVMTEVLTVAYCGFLKAMSPYPMGKEGFGPGDTVVVLGAGPLGICHGIMAKMAGSDKVIVIGAPEGRLELAKKLCADYTVNIDNVTDPAQRVREVKALTENRGAALVAECAGVPEAVSQGLDMLRIGGTMIVAGNYIDMGPVHINPQKQILSKNARIIGVNGQTASSYAASLRLIRRFSQSIPIEKMVTHRFKIQDARHALETGISMQAMEVAITP
jgi:threonine dehydrogenase-like Zn-dependent dehydrogenase